MNNKICVYAICKNEMKFIENWLKSMSEADYIAVLDSGSTDGTYELLKEKSESEYRGKLIISQKVINPWRFDTARNESLKLVPDDANICMCTDMDELLDPGWAEILRSSWNDKIHTRATYKYAWSHDENGNPGRVFAYNKIHDKTWTWKYPVHELLYRESTNSNSYPIEESLDLFDSIYLHHYPDLSKSRGSYLPLLELREKEDPTDYYGLIYLSHEYYYRGYYEKSIEKLKYILEQFPDKINSVEKASCFLFMGDSYKATGDNNKAISAYISAINADNSYREPYINLAKVLIEKEDFSFAYDLLKIALQKTYRHWTWLERDNSWTWELYDLLSLSSYYSGYKQESLYFAVKALSFNETDERLKDNVKIIMNSIDEKEIVKNF